jgi:hypothetical protein
MSTPVESSRTSSRDRRPGRSAALLPANPALAPHRHAHLKHHGGTVAVEPQFKNCPDLLQSDCADGGLATAAHDQSDPFGWRQNQDGAREAVSGIPELAIPRHAVAHTRFVARSSCSSVDKTIFMTQWRVSLRYRYPSGPPGGGSVIDNAGYKELKKIIGMVMGPTKAAALVGQRLIIWLSGLGKYQLVDVVASPDFQCVTTDEYPRPDNGDGTQTVDAAIAIR